MALFRRDVLQAAEKLVAKGKVEAAIKEYRRYLERSPDDTNTLNRVGDLYARLRKNDTAIKYYRQTAERYANDGFYVKSIAVYKKIHRLEPGRIDIHERLAELYQRQGLISDARGHYHQLADHHLRANNPVAAIGVFEKLAELEPENPSHWLRLADLHREQGQLRQALRAYGSIASLMLSHGQTDHAFQVYERAVQVDPSDLDFVSDAIAALKQAAGDEKASELLAVAVAHNPEARRLQSLLGTGQVPIPPDAAQQTATSQPAPSSPLPPAEPAPPPQPSPSVAAPAPQAQPSPPPAAQRPAAQPSPQPAAPAASAPGSDSVSFEAQSELAGVELEIDLDPAAELSRPATSGKAAESEDFELIEEPTGAVPTPAAPEAESDEDLISEADVFLKYGLMEKAADRLNELLETHPGNLEALSRLVGLHLDQHDHEAAIARATELYRQTDGGLDEAWARVEKKLVAEGFVVEGGEISAAKPAPASDSAAMPQVEASPEVEAGPADGIEAEVDDLPAADIEVQPFELGLDEDDFLDEEDLDLPPAEVEAPAEPEPAAMAEETLAPEEAATPASEAVAEEGEIDLEELIEAAAREEQAEEPVKEPPQEPVEEPPVEPTEEPAEREPALQESQPFVTVSEDTSESGVTPAWLEDVDEVAAEEEGERLFAEEDAFFDLAAELQGALGEDAPAEVAEGEPAAAAPSEQSLEQIVEGFKKGVAENISEEESDTHYNLGIAYREMMLLDEAIGEFQISAKDPRYLADSCTMLGLCFRDKGLNDLAVKWYRRALASDGLDEEQRLGLLYDLASTYELMEERSSAYDTFVEIYGLNTNYRDVSEKVEQLQPT